MTLERSSSDPPESLPEDCPYISNRQCVSAISIEVNIFGDFSSFLFLLYASDRPSIHSLGGWFLFDGLFEEWHLRPPKQFTSKQTTSIVTKHIMKKRLAKSKRVKNKS